MLNQLRFKVTFANPIKTIEGNHYFNEGLTGITGKNGEGKSLILELIDYNLHGTEALRGKADDYATLETSLDFELKGRSFRLDRSTKKVALRELIDGQVVDLASGTKPVNLKIEELFGYSSAVFRMANYCKQGKIEELGDMLPTARKRLVDETVGLTVLDEVTSFIDGKRKDLNTGITAIEGFLKAPVEPQKLEVAHNSATYKLMRDDLRTGINSRNSWRAIAQRPLQEPAIPEQPENDDLLDQFKLEQTKRANLAVEYGVLDREMKAIPIYTGPIVENLHPKDADLDALKLVMKTTERLMTEISVNEKGLKNYNWTEPVMAEAEIEAYRARHVLVDRWNQKQKLLAKNIPHDCPKCNHHWEDQDPRVEAEYGDVTENPGYGIEPAQLAKEANNLIRFELGSPIKTHIEELKAELAPLAYEQVKALINEIEDTRHQYQLSQKARDHNKRREELAEKMTALMAEYQAMPDHAEAIKVIEAFRMAWAQYQVKKQAYDVAAAEKKDAEERLEYFRESLDAEYEEADKNYVLALNYETNLVNYNQAKETYDKALEQLNNLKAELLEWTNARQAVVDLRAKVKGYLLPSLNTVASLLISQMTGGELSFINIDEAFNITVEGQRLETLSGAGKAVANLAIRIGLGQVLTNRVFSVMMLDEIDASCDDDRASYIAQCMKNLTKTIKQVIQVSHKSGLVADHHVRV